MLYPSTRGLDTSQSSLLFNNCSIIAHLVGSAFQCFDMSGECVIVANGPALGN